MKKQLSIYQNRINEKLAEFLNISLQDTPSMLSEAIRYATLNNGKRLRPALLYAMGEAFEIAPDKLDTPAIAIELIHSYSLVHDDLPAMDDDEMRRGQPTCHIQYDEATAILVGDAQQALAFKAISDSNIILDSDKIKLIQTLSNACGPSGMVGGQHIDMQSSGHLPEQQQLQKMHLMKTGALIKASLIMGACQSPYFKEKYKGLIDFGTNIGLAFQVQDDILDIESSSEILGKPQGSDESSDKSTYPKLMGLDASKNYRNQLISEAIETLRTYQIDSPFLISVSRFIAERTY